MDTSYPTRNAGEVTVMRHTRVEGGEGVCYGRTEMKVAASFEEEARAVQAQVGEGWEVVFTSPAERCRRLAETLGARRVIVDTRLAELDFGRWEGRRWAELAGPELDGWMADFVNVAPPGGESFRQLAERVAAFREERGAWAETRVAVVTHAGVIRAWSCAVGGVPLTEAFKLAVDFGGVFRMGWADFKTD
jgi:alpha-ribazole phosphatase